MGRVRVFVLLLSLLMLSGCIGLFGGTTTRITGTVRIDTSSGASAESIAPSSVAARFLGMPAGGAVFTPSIHMTEPTPQAVPVEVLLYADRLSGAEARGLAEQHGFTYLRSSQDGYHVLRDRMGRSEARAISDIKGAAGGARVEPNRPLYPLAVNDPRFNEQWALQAINVVPAWDVVDWSGVEVVVAIVDSEIDFSHPDLNKFDLWTENGIDFTDPAQPEGRPYIFDPDGPKATQPHGTMVAGIIAALTNNGEGIAGTVGPGANVKLMPVRVFRGGNVDEETIARAIKWAVDEGADVINLSLGDSCDDLHECRRPGFQLRSALDYAWDQGVAVVAASGNFGGAVVMPANYRTTIAVGAVNAAGVKESYSSFGEGLDVVAPGGAAESSNCTVGVLSPRAGGAYACNQWGTSIAAPHVSGILALMIARYRALGLDYGPDDLRQILQITATDLKTPGWDKDTGYGLVNAHAAVTAGVPRIFVAKKSGDALEAPHAPVRSQLGGVFTLSGMPEGTWSLFGWVDSDMSGTVNDGDYFQEYGLVNVKKGKNVSVTLVLTRYDGDELNVNW